jgi:hypothetical protein
LPSDSLFAVNRGYIGLYFASLPGWFIAAALYLLLSKLMQRDTRPGGAAT